MTPIPLNGKFRVELVALLEKTIEPVSRPLAVGEKVTEKLMLLPAPIVAGVLMPLMLKPALDETCEIVMLVLPEFTRVAA